MRNRKVNQMQRLVFLILVVPSLRTFADESRSTFPTFEIVTEMAVHELPMRSVRRVQFGEKELFYLVGHDWGDAVSWRNAGELWGHSRLEGQFQTARQV